MIGPTTAARTMLHTFRQAGTPLASYYAVSILIPLANGSGSTSSAFLEHMSFVVLAPPAMISLFALLRQAWQKVR